MPTIHNLRLTGFDLNRNAYLEEANRKGQRIYVSSEILHRAFITRAWLDRTLIDCAFGKCLLSAEVENRGNRLEATKIWLNLEMNTASESRDRSLFGHFGLELNKPKKGTNAYEDLTNHEKVTDKLGKRFKVTENEREQKKTGDLIGFRFNNDFLEKLDKKQIQRAQAFAKNGFLDCTFTPNWRMVTGMGEASVYETNLTLHHTYGVPYIPASTIKGILRRAFDQETEKSIIKQLFGEGDEKSSMQKNIRGQAIFFDAFPIKAPRIELDVMTPHYPEYYSSGKPPADWQSPIPITFLTVGQGTPFRFLIVLPDASLKNDVKDRLKDILSENGLGAKTAVGYGTFKEMK